VPALPPLSEADRADAEGFLGDMLVIYPLLDVRAFEIPSAAESASELLLKGSGAQAKGRETTRGFLVLAGAQARATTVPSLAGYPVVLKLREQLQAKGILVQSDGCLLLTQDYEFSAPSTAATVLMGRSADGRKEWKDGSARSLKEIAQAALAP